MEVLPRAVHPHVAGLLAGGPVADQLGQVGEHRHDVELGAQQGGVGGQGVGAQPLVLRQGLGPVGGGDVEAEQHAAQVGEQCRSAGSGAGRLGRRGQVQLGFGARGAHVRRRTRLLVGERLEAHHRHPGLDLASGGHHQLAHPGRERGRDHRLHLHALEHEHGSAGRHRRADRDRGGDDQGWCGGAQDAALVPADAVGDAVHLDQMHGTVGRTDEPEHLVADVQPAGELTQLLDRDVEDVLGAGRPEADAEPVGADLGHGDPVTGAAELEVDSAADLVPGLRPPAVGRGEEVPPLGRLLFLVRRDGRGDERETGMPAAPRVDPRRGRGRSTRCRRCRRRPRAGRAGPAGSSCWSRRPR